MSKPVEPYLSVEEAARATGISRRRIQRMAAAGEIAGAFTVGVGRNARMRLWIIPTAWVGEELVQLARALAAIVLTRSASREPSTEEEAA